MKKLLVIGPPNSGKTLFCEATSNTLELKKPGVDNETGITLYYARYLIRKRIHDVSKLFQIWDCDDKFETSRRVRKDVDGAFIVVSTDNKSIEDVVRVGMSYYNDLINRLHHRVPVVFVFTISEHSNSMNISMKNNPCEKIGYAIDVNLNNRMNLALPFINLARSVLGIDIVALVRITVKQEDFKSICKLLDNESAVCLPASINNTILFDKTTVSPLLYKHLQSIADKIEKPE